MKFLLAILSLLTILTTKSYAEACGRTCKQNLGSDVIANLEKIDDELVDYNHSEKGIKLAYYSVRISAIALTRNKNILRVSNPTEADIINLLEQIGDVVNPTKRSSIYCLVNVKLKMVLAILKHFRTGTAGVAVLAFSGVTDPYDFGSILVGATASNLFTISNTGNTTANGISASATGDYTVIPGGTCSSTLAAGASCTINVQFSAVNFGSSNGSLSVNSSNAGNLSLSLVGSTFN